MKRENNPASMMAHFANASILKTAILAVVSIPGAYPNQPSRTRIVTAGSFPIDVPESVEEVILRWRGDSGSDEVRIQRLEKRVVELETKLKLVGVSLTGFEVPKSLDAADLLARVDRALKEAS
jgi:hypothetical protein